MRTIELELNGYNFSITNDVIKNVWVIAYFQPPLTHRITIEELTKYQAALGLLWHELNQRNCKHLLAYGGIGDTCSDCGLFIA